MFSLYISDTSEYSVIEFGGSDLKKYSSNPAAAVVLNVDKTFYWSCNVAGYAVTDYVNNAVSSTGTTAIFDSGTSLSYIPACKYIRCLS